MQGRRLPDGAHFRDAEPGDYWKQPYHEDADFNGPRGVSWQWTIRDPDARYGTIATHTVEEHEDGTITVDPSIWDHPDGYHGHLVKGVWSP